MCIEMTDIKILQPALPSYRIDFFERLYREYGAKFTLFYSNTHLTGLTAEKNVFPWATEIGPIRALPLGLDWQMGALSVPIERGDILVVSGAPRTLSTLLLILKARLTGSKVVWWGHYWSSTSKKWRFFIRLILMRTANAWLFYTDLEVTEYLSLKKVSEKRLVSALNNGLATDQIKKLREPYISANRAREILFIGRLTEKAQVELLLNALAQSAMTDIKLHIVGGGPMEQTLRQLAERLALHERVYWHGAVTDEAWIAKIANNCRIFAYPGEVGLSLIHAMGYGLPCVVHDKREKHMPEIAAFENAKTGLTFTYGNKRDFVDTLVGFIDDHNLLNMASRAAVDAIDSSFNTANMTERFVDFVRSLQSEFEGDVRQ